MATAMALTVQEEQAVQEFITIINDYRLQHSIGPLSWSTAVKFMMARKFSVQRALELYDAHEMLRRSEGLAKFDPTNSPLKLELETGKFTILPTRDPDGAALVLFSAGKHNPFITSRQTTLQGIVYQLDVALESFQTQRCGIVFIYNMQESRYSNFDYELSQRILNLLRGCYPARLKKVLIVTAPLWFKAPFKILRLFVREKIRERIYTVNNQQLSLHIPTSCLPKELGGDVIINHSAWLQHCLKSMVNRCEDISGLTSTLTSPSLIPNGQLLTHIIHNKNINGPLVNMLSSEGETDESSDHQISVHEKQNSEDREKEVEVTKEDKKDDAVDVVNKEKYDEMSLSTPSSSLSNDSLHSESGQGLTLEEFIDQLQKKGKKGLYREYAEIKAKPIGGTFECSRLKSNQPKNRYTDVLCYDHSRVKIQHTDPDPTSDYVNANFVDGYKHKNAFIATQGPLPKTFTDFWKMIWEQQVAVIIMTTRTIERSRAKCGQYWPKDELTSLEHGNFFVYNASVEQFSDYVITNLILTNTETGCFIKLYHMQFTSWPDYGVPHSALAMLDFRDKVREKQIQCLTNRDSKWNNDHHHHGPPMVIHCSAGIGRTGTFITLDICISRLEVTGLIDVQATVEKIRSQRAHSIQMPDQYVFCHLALLEFALSRGLLHDVDLSSFNDSDSESE